MPSGIYKIVNKINGKFYIGSSISIKGRWSMHKSELKNEKHHNIHLQNSWNKYGSENFKFEIIEIVENEENLIKREQYYLDTLNPEYNICEVAGSCLGRELSEEHKEKISKAMKGKELSEEHKEKLRKAMLGHKTSYKTKMKISKANSGKKHGMHGKHHTKSAREKISKNHADVSGSNHPLFGKELSKSHKAKIREANSKNRYGEDNPMYGRVGESCPNSKLKKKDVLEIRKLLKNEKYVQKDLAKEYNVSVSAISNIKNRNTWRHI